MKKYRVISKVIGTLEIDGGILLSHLGHVDVDEITEQLRWMLGMKQIEIKELKS